MPKLIDISGQVFGRLTVLSRVSATGQARWACACECGNKSVVAGYDLRTGAIKSCGCLRNQRTSEANTTHGRSKSKEYFAWINMRNRCHRAEDKSFGRYGALGIAVCERWRDSFANFFADLGECPDGHSLDRIDPTGNYSPENCRWADWSIQQNNKRRIKSATLNGVTKPIAVWCRELGLDAHTIRARVYTLGWEPERALRTPIVR